MASYAFKKRRVKILDSYISYIDSRAGEEIVIFLHGNPTSSYVWRHVVPYVQGVARCIAPDLLGYGDSGKEPKHNYSFDNHYKYFSTWLGGLKLDGKYVFVCQELGSMLAFRWAKSHEDKVRAIVLLEGIVTPFHSLDDLGPRNDTNLYHALRAKDTDEKVINDNQLLNQYLSNVAISKTLSDADMRAYMSAFAKAGESRRPIVTGVKDIPIENEGPSDIIDVARDYFNWLCDCPEIPKLYIHVEPGLFSPFTLNQIGTWARMEVVKVKGKHLAQEESPEEIGRAIKDFVQNLDAIII